MPSTQHRELAQHLATDEVVQLFELDTTPTGVGGIFHFTPGTVGGAEVAYQGIYYPPYPIELSGWEVTTQGNQPRPKLSISNIGGFIAGLVIAGNDLVGARLTRIRTFGRFLDGKPGADPDAHWPAQTMLVDRKSLQNKTIIEWELATPIDNKNLKIPGRLALKNSCFQRYRAYIAEGSYFDYSRATCPYTGSNYSTPQGTITSDASKDQCGRRLSDCRFRFGQNSTLPFAGFPGMQRL